MSWVSTGISVVGGIAGMMGGSKSGERAAKDANARANYQMESAQRSAKAATQPFVETGTQANRLLSQYLGTDTSGYGVARPTLEKFQNELRAEHFKRFGQDYNRNSNVAGQNAEADRRYQDALKDWESGLEEYKANNQDAMGDGRLLKEFTNEDFVKDPGYEFRMDEGLKGTDRYFASRGGYDSGAALKASQRFVQDYASNEYGNAYNRDALDKNRIYTMLSGQSSQGLNAAQGTANLGANAANQSGQNSMNLANNQWSQQLQQNNNQTNSLQAMLGNLAYTYGKNKAPNASVFSTPPYVPPSSSSGPGINLAGLNPWN